MFVFPLKQERKTPAPVKFHYSSATLVSNYQSINVQPKKMGHVQTQWVYWQEEQSCDFHAFISCCIQMAQKNPQWSCSPCRGGHISNMKKFCLAFYKIATNHFKPVLKFGMLIRGPKANICTKFKANPINIQVIKTILCIKQSQTSVTPSRWTASWQLLCS